MNKTTENYRLFKLDETYKTRTNLNKHIDDVQKFYNGNQYPDKNYKNMLRITLNICSMAANIKASKIVGTPIYIQYISDKNNIDCSKLERFDEYNTSKLNEKTENFQSALNGFVNGTEIIYYRWDEEDTSYKGIYKGGLAIEHIDPRNFAVANPYISDIQNQKWVMFWKDEEVGAVRELVEGKNDKEIKEKQEKILPDDYEQKEGQYAEHPEEINHGMVRVYTRYFRVNGEVCFMSSTKEVDLFQYPHAMSPYVSKKILKSLQEKLDKLKEKVNDAENNKTELEKIPDYEIDFENIIIQTEPKAMNDKEYREEKEKFSLYPFASFVPFVINGSFYGRSDIESLISPQKAVNFSISMLLACVQNNAYSKIFAKDGALLGQEITGDPGQIIIDHTRYANGWGIKLAESQPIPTALLGLTNELISMVRNINGFSDVMDGTITNQDLSGYAVQQMIKQSNTNIEQQQQIFWKFCKDKAAIRLLFYKFYVDSATYTIEKPRYEVELQENARRILERRMDQLSASGRTLEIGGEENLEKIRKPVSKYQTDTITKDELLGVNFDINIDVMQGLADSKLSEGQFWDNLVLNGTLNNIEPEKLEMYMNANPMVSKRTQQILKSVIDKQKLEENAKLKQQLAAVTQQLEQATVYIQQLQQQGEYKSKYIDSLSKEFTRKINVANKMINAQNYSLQKNNNATRPSANQVSDGEAKSLNSRGIAGSDIYPSNNG